MSRDHTINASHQRPCARPQRPLVVCAYALLAFHAAACASLDNHGGATEPEVSTASCGVLHAKLESAQTSPPSSFELEPGAYYVIQNPAPHDGTPLTLHASQNWPWQVCRAGRFIPYKLVANDGATAQSATWTGYAEALHHRVHPIFVDQFLASLSAEEVAAEFDNPNLAATVDVALDVRTGAVTQIGFVAPRKSVVPFFFAAIEAVVRGSKLAPPAELAGMDGSVYFQWTLYRDPQRSCSTYFLRPTESSLH
jgi:hypothetical protein